MLPRTAIAVSLILAAAARAAAAQCPDGTPPPCRAAAPVRRATPPLDERTWIVLPFENVARVPEVDWLRDASVNLLYLDLSKWRDIRVIDDERVADYVREAPEARGGAAMGLTAGIAVARRAGAGKLVMGDLLKVGSRTRVVAKVFDVRSGQRLRSVQQDAQNPDSLILVFERLARGILNAEPPPGAGGAIGTTSLGAYQEYVAGVRALTSWDLDGAKQHFERALQLDTTFALAHYKLSVTYGWESSTAPARVMHAEAASRFAAGLPARERTLIAGQLAQARGHWGEACDAYTSLARADSTDTEAWYNVGECNFHDPAVVTVGGDTTHLAFRSSWTTALRAFRRTLELDPTYHLAFAHIPDILGADLRSGCRMDTPDSACSTTYVAYVIRQADTLVTVPVAAANSAALLAQAAEAVRTGTRHANAVLARDLAAEWVQAGPDEPRAHRALGRALLRTGDPDGADRELRQVGPGSSRPERVQSSIDRMEIAIKRDRFEQATALFDTLQAIVDSVRDPQVRSQAGLMAVGFGRFAQADADLRAVAPAPLIPLVAVLIRVEAGVAPDSSERVVQAALADPSVGARVRPLVTVLSMWALGAMRGWSAVPPFDTTVLERRSRVSVALLRGDTAAARAKLAALDSFLLALPAESPTGGAFLVSAEAHLMLGDSAAAYERMLGFERHFPYAPMMEQLASGLIFGSFIWPRSFLLLGDLATAQGHPDVAARAYRRLVGLWGTGDRDVQPALARARAALTRLDAGGTR